MMLSAGVAFIYFFFCVQIFLYFFPPICCAGVFSERLICVYSCHVRVCRVCQPKQACVTELSPLCEQFFFSINQHWNGMGSFSAVWVFCVNFILLSWNPVFLCTLMYSSCLFLLLPDQWQAVMPTCSLHHLLIFLFLLAHLLFCHIFPFCVFFYFCCVFSIDISHPHLTVFSPLSPISLFIFSLCFAVSFLFAHGLTEMEYNLNVESNQYMEF